LSIIANDSTQSDSEFDSTTVSIQNSAQNTVEENPNQSHQKSHIQLTNPMSSRTGTINKNFCSQQFCCHQLQRHSHSILAVARGQARKKAKNFIEIDDEENIVVSLPPELASQPNPKSFENESPE
jgi:hypothetical protein